MSKRSWSEYPILPAPPGEATTGEIGQRRFAEIPQSEWHSLFTWAIGPDHIVRCLDLRPPEPVKVVCEQDGQRIVRWEERTYGDRSVVESGIDHYLTAARVPSQPCGYRWFVELPDGIADLDHLSSRFTSHRAKTPVNLMPLQERELMEEVAATLYTTRG
ncbi:DUF5956 family protein [Nocardiopsis sp. NPDC006139]|uniref:DUF5956 family protein n=1 Tax=Nocardiopsis sp. NPDC006139 TaxID=3154578 RepID=UPI0033B8D806